MVGDEWNGEQEVAQGHAAIRATGVETGNSFALLECTLPPYGTGPGQHLHRRTTETVYILRGTLACTVGDETMVAGAGSLILVPPGKTHRFWNPTGKSAVYLTLLSPPGVEGYAAAVMDSALAATLAAQAAEHDHYPV